MMERHNPNHTLVEKSLERKGTQDSGALAAFRRTISGRPKYVELRRKSVDRRSLLLQDLHGPSGRRGSSSISSVASSITLSDFDEIPSCGSMRWKVDYNLTVPQEEEENGLDDNSIPAKRDSNSMSLPTCPTRRVSINSIESSDTIIVSLSHLPSIQNKRACSKSPPTMPWRKSSARRLDIDRKPLLDCKPVKPGRQVSVSTTTQNE